MALTMNPWRWTVAAGEPMGMEFARVDKATGLPRSLLGETWVLTVFDQSRAMIESVESQIVQALVLGHVGDVARMAFPIGTSERLLGMRMLAWELAMKIGTGAERRARWRGSCSIITSAGSVAGSGGTYGEPTFDRITVRG